jgi:cytoskeletal protein RodZ
MDPQSFSEFLQAQISEKGLTVEKLARQTGISERHLRALFEGDYKKLPSAPYVRGYLSKIAALLDLNTNSLWKIYQDEHHTYHSGPKDVLPLNRYALKRVNKKSLLGVLIVAVVVAYVFVNAPRLFGQPDLQLTIPTTEEDTISTAETIVLQGSINPGDRLRVSDQEVGVQSDGTFSYSYHLEPGLNRIEFRVNRFLGRELVVVRNVIFVNP